MTPITESFHQFEKSRWQEAAEGYHCFWFSDPEVSCQALLLAGYTAPEVKKIPLTWYFKNSEDFFTAFYTGTARTGPMLRAQSPEALEMIHRVIEESVTDYQSNDNIKIPMAAMLYHAIKP